MLSRESSSYVLLAGLFSNTRFVTIFSLSVGCCLTFLMNLFEAQRFLTLTSFLLVVLKVFVLLCLIYFCMQSFFLGGQGMYKDKGNQSSCPMNHSSSGGPNPVAHQKGQGQAWSFRHPTPHPADMTTLLSLSAPLSPALHWLLTNLRVDLPSNSLEGC